MMNQNLLIKNIFNENDLYAFDDNEMAMVIGGGDEPTLLYYESPSKQGDITEAEKQAYIDLNK